MFFQVNVFCCFLKEDKKRRHTEVVAEVAEDQGSSVTQEPPVKAKKARKKELSKAEKKLAHR